ncbi:CU044_5270 family protein [Dactylosporangium sp. NBC_01737]|uniref:CU044_5270 family protein n=1 Tax=Dactylosporangium sp. NBC_01737 TaxID=2975959 RepID=UPI002E1404CC|nr:CU044_5270 family protein [Dactylosporangium sp. NBC_01737]
MDELELLAGARPVTPPSAETVNEARRHLARQIYAKPASHWRVRLMLPIAAGALAVSTGIVVGAHVLSPAPSAPPGANGSPGPARTWDTGPLKPDNRSAQDLLLTAAEQTLHQTDPGSGKYWLSSWEEGQLIQVGQKGAEYAIMGHYSYNEWYSIKDRFNVFETRWAGAEPASDADKAAWKKAGSPSSWPIDQGPGCPSDPNKSYTIDAAKTSQVSRSDEGAGKEPSQFRVLGEYLTADQIRALPSDPAALKQWLIGVIQKRNLPHKSDVELGESLFAGVQNLLFFNPITPQVRAAAYKVLAGMPGVTSLGAVKDGKGRNGVAVSITSNDTVEEQRADSGGPYAVSIVFSPDTGDTLSFETRVIKPADYLSWVPKGALFSYRAVMEMRWTNDEPPAGNTPSMVMHSAGTC